jgi:hypothetical protein
MLAISIPWEFSDGIEAQAILEPIIHIIPANNQITLYWQALNPRNGEAFGKTGVQTLPTEMFQQFRKIFEEQFFQQFLAMGAVDCENGVKIAFDKAQIIELPEPEPAKEGA